MSGKMEARRKVEERGERGDGSGVRPKLCTCPNHCPLQTQLHWTAALETG